MEWHLGSLTCSFAGVSPILSISLNLLIQFLSYQIKPMPQTFYMCYEAARVHRIYQAYVISKRRGEKKREESITTNTFQICPLIYEIF